MPLEGCLVWFAPFCGDHGRVSLKALRLALAVGLMSVLLGATPAHATDCSDPKKPCGGCHINREISTSDLRPIICYA